MAKTIIVKLEVKEDNLLATDEQLIGAVLRNWDGFLFTDSEPHAEIVRMTAVVVDS